MAVLKFRLQTLLDFVRFEHTLFALPFAYSAMLLASQKHLGVAWPGFGVFFWITAAMVGARTAAMAANRLIDAGIDARNPRTANREIPTGKVTPTQAVVLIVFSLALLIFAAFQLNALALTLLPLALVFLIVYPYTKRFTWLCHVWLGITDGAAAAGGWIAVTGTWSLEASLLMAVVVFWMIGLDIIYATQDVDFDRKNGIHSIPARFGIVQSLRISAASHAITFALLLSVAWVAQTHWVFFVATAIMGGILLFEHMLVKPNDLQRVNIAFFNANSYLALTMLVGTLLDVWIR